MKYHQNSSKNAALHSHNGLDQLHNTSRMELKPNMSPTQKRVITTGCGSINSFLHMRATQSVDVVAER